MTATEAAADRTRERLIRVAGEIFAERGYRDATIRDIARKAKANLAAVNYHFGDKNGLYRAVLTAWKEPAFRRFPLDEGLAAQPTPAERLRAFLRGFLRRLLDGGHPSWHSQVMARELAEPTGALDVVIESMMRPTYEHLMAVVHDVLGSRAPMDRIRRSAKSIIGQCLFYKHCAPILDRFGEPAPSRPADIDRLADHILEFSLHGLLGRRSG